ncbi:metal-dependent hydrolase [Altererythrobacter xixiisoli]|uniref:Metal-dependent hydrolase n=1 Tax=Croceibacterium xixiisoli TaxID=1476466 RepID=A0A6I4TWD3_9SPHN|nr:metal-dependent hydrolase [Croceibacterium xixiisoli]MXO99097.1 metal-dependent hydrolase [Croceibacterium xixiisoli]
MDNLTHSLVGALIGQAGLKKKTGLAMPALIIGANIPDIDATCTIYGLESLAMRRGLTHGPIAWVLLPLALAMLLWAWDRWQAKRGKRPAARAPVHFWWLYGLALIGCLTHPALDWMNNYGVRLLEPFSQQWFYGDTLFIIDLWMWIGLGLATWFSLRREKRGGEWRLPARAALAGLLVYIGANMLITYRTELSGQGVEPYPNQVIASPPPVAFWRRDVITSTGPGLWQVNGEDVGNIPLSRCDLDAAGQTDPRVAAFLFWSRAPFLHRKADGQWVLADARYVRAPTGGDRFSVILPHGLCREESQKEAG